MIAVLVLVGLITKDVMQIEQNQGEAIANNIVQLTGDERLQERFTLFILNAVMEHPVVSGVIIDYQARLDEATPIIESLITDSNALVRVTRESLENGPLRTLVDDAEALIQRLTSLEVQLHTLFAIFGREMQDIMNADNDADDGLLMEFEHMVVPKQRRSGGDDDDDNDNGVGVRIRAPASRGLLSKVNEDSKKT